VLREPQCVWFDIIREFTASYASNSDGWFKGPPYAVAETVLDENDIEGRDPVKGIS
jgi:hypothetical protein